MLLPRFLKFRTEFMTLGSAIQKARKHAAFSIDDLAAATNIRPTLLIEMENNNFFNCGGETYARGHIRNIAHKLDADEQELLRIYDEEQAMSKRSMRELLVESNVMRQPLDKRKISWKALSVISIACLGVAGLAQIVISNNASIKIIAPSVSQSTAPSVTASDSPSVAPSPSSSPDPTSQTSFSTGVGVEVVADAAHGTSWLFVSDESGRTLFSGQILRGEVKTFSSQTRLNLRIGNAGGLDLQVNGKNIASTGGNGEVVSLSYGVDS